MSHPLSEYRTRVIDDAFELAAVIEIAEPLTQKTMQKLAPQKAMSALAMIATAKADMFSAQAGVR